MDLSYRTVGGHIPIYCKSPLLFSKTLSWIDAVVRFPRQPPRKPSFCLGRRIKQPQIDNLLGFLAKPRQCSPYGKSTTLHQSTRRRGVSEGLAPVRRSQHAPFRTPPTVRRRPRVAGPSAAFGRGWAQRRIPRDTAKRHGPPPRALARLISP